MIVLARLAAEDLVEELLSVEQAHRIHVREHRERARFERLLRVVGLEARGARRLERLRYTGVRHAILRGHQPGLLRTPMVGCERGILDGQTEETRAAERL